MGCCVGVYIYTCRVGMPNMKYSIVVDPTWDIIEQLNMVDSDEKVSNSPFNFFLTAFNFWLMRSYMSDVCFSFLVQKLLKIRS